MSFVNAGAAIVLNSIRKDHTKKINGSNNSRAEAHKLLDEDKDLKRVYVNHGVDSSIIDQDIGNRHYVYTFEIYVRGHKGPYLFQINSSAGFDQLYNGYPYVRFYERLFDKDGVYIMKNKWIEIIGSSVGYYICDFDEMPKSRGYQYFFETNLC